MLVTNRMRPATQSGLALRWKRECACGHGQQHCPSVCKARNAAASSDQGPFTDEDLLHCFWFFGMVLCSRPGTHVSSPVLGCMQMRIRGCV